MVLLIILALLLIIVLAMIFGRLDLLYGIALIVIVIVVGALLGGLEIHN